MQKLWDAARFPLILLAVLALLSSLWFLLDLPPQEELIEMLRVFMAKYGYIVVLCGSFVEALLLVGLYFPGSLIIFLSVIMAPSVSAAVISIALVSVGLYMGYLADYALGKYGWYKVLIVFGLRAQLEKAQKKLEIYGARAIFLSFWNPGLAAFMATAAGVLQFNLKRFLLLSLGAVIVWNIFWGVLVYFVGEQAFGMFLSWPFALTMFTIWIAIRYLEAYFSKEEREL